MPGVSSKSVVVGVRLPVATVKKVRANAIADGITVSVYLGKIINRQVMRKR